MKIYSKFLNYSSYTTYYKLVFVFWLCCLTGSSLLAQNAYVQLEDASGVDNSDYQTVLASAAEELLQVFPADVQSQFAVYDFGFYLHQQSFEGMGFPEVFRQKQLEVEQQTPFYLLFGKQTDKDGIYTKFWVKVKLPDGDNFPCVDEMKRTIIEEQVILATQEQYAQDDHDFRYYHLAEKAGIEKLKHYVEKIINCCGDSNCCGTAGGGFRNESDNCSEDLFSIEEVIPVILLNGYAEFAANEVHYSQSSTGELSIDLVYGGTDEMPGTYAIPFSSEFDYFINQMESDYGAVNIWSDISYYDDDTFADFLSNPNFPVFNNLIYEEHVLAFNVNGKKRLFFKINHNTSTALRSGSGGQDRAFAPVVAWLIKRAAMGGVSVLTYVGTEWALEKWIGGHATMLEAWPHTNITYMGIFWAGVDGIASDQNIVQVLLPIFRNVAIYLYQTGIQDLEMEAVGVEVLKGFGEGLANILIGNLVDRILPKISKYSTAAYDRFQIIVNKGRHFAYFNDLFSIGMENIATFVNKPKMLDSWEVLDEYLPDYLKHLRRDLTHLEFLQNTDVQNALKRVLEKKAHLLVDYPDLTPAQLAALNYYTTDAGYQINYWLRGEPVLEGVEWSEDHANRFYTQLESALSKLSGYTGGPTLWRIEFREFAELATWKKGDKLDYPNYISTAKSTSSTFINGLKEHTVLFKITNKSDFVKDIEAFADEVKELEALILSGKKLEIFCL